MIKLDSNINNKNPFRDTDLICYCFNYTKKDIEEDFNKNGCSRILEKITKEKSIGGCHCEVKNPKGK
jgi:NAD(P)H-nitrite reductase large subunit